MNDAKIMQLFQMFAMIPDAEPWRDLAEAEMKAVRAELRDGADDSDNRLAFYTAARANLQYRRTVAQNTPGSLAQRLVRAYRAECAPLLRDDAFTFLRTGECT